VIDATVKRAVDNENKVDQNFSIKNARFLDIKNVFSKIEAPFPNTMLNIEEFEEKARNLV
jgi:thiosulfate/3-mercaptopyruvate sulfurtransferase